MPLALLPDHFAVQGVALYRDAAGLLDQPADFRDGQLLGRVRPGVVVNLLVNHRAVEVVGPEAERDLGQGNAAPRNVLADQAPAGGNGGGG